MAGGTKKPVNIFRLGNVDDPKEVFNWRLWLAVLSFGLMGAARGVDEGLISGAFNSVDFQRTIHLDQYSEIEQTNIKGDVSAMVQIGSVGGALLYEIFPSTLPCFETLFHCIFFRLFLTSLQCLCRL